MIYTAPYRISEYTVRACPRCYESSTAVLYGGFCMSAHAAGRLTALVGGSRPLAPPPVWSTVYYCKRLLGPVFTILNGPPGQFEVDFLENHDTGNKQVPVVAQGESVIKCPSPLNELKDKYDHSYY